MIYMYLYMLQKKETNQKQQKMRHGTFTNN